MLRRLFERWSWWQIDLSLLGLGLGVNWLYYRTAFSDGDKIEAVLANLSIDFFLLWLTIRIVDQIVKKREVRGNIRRSVFLSTRHLLDISRQLKQSVYKEAMDDIHEDLLIFMYKGRNKMEYLDEKERLALIEINKTFVSLGTPVLGFTLAKDRAVSASNFLDSHYNIGDYHINGNTAHNESMDTLKEYYSVMNNMLAYINDSRATFPTAYMLSEITEQCDLAAALLDSGDIDEDPMNCSMIVTHFRRFCDRLREAATQREAIQQVADQVQRHIHTLRRDMLEDTEID
jgi:hypothetical protein